MAFPFARSILVTAAIGASLLGCAAPGDVSALKGGKRGGGSETTSDTSESPAFEGPESAFPYGAEVALLPYEVRLSKLARVAGVEPTHSMFQLVVARRLELGDHDYATGVKPDLAWSSSRITAWVKAIKPVCASKPMREKFPALPENLDELLLDAYGRPVEDEDRASITEALGTALDSESAYQVTCLAVLSSLEFVAR